MYDIHIKRSDVVKYFNFNFFNFVIIICFLTRVLTLVVLFLTALKAAAVAKPIILGILSSISLILAL